LQFFICFVVDLSLSLSIKKVVTKIGELIELEINLFIIIIILHLY